MSLFGFGSRPDINAAVDECGKTPGAVLLDVRMPEEYAEGHIEGSVNLPLGRLNDVYNIIEDTDTPIFAYCLSGARSMQACALLEEMGYSSVVNAGGIDRYRGKVVR